MQTPLPRKLKRQKTDAEPVPSSEGDFENRPEAKNLMTIYSALSGEDMNALFSQFGGKTFGEFKPALADVAVSHLEPITTRMNQLMEDPQEIDKILIKGGEKCNATAQPFLQKTMDIMGFWKG